MTLNVNRLSKTHCILYRFVGCILVFTSLINLWVIFQYLLKRYYNRRKQFLRNRLSPIMLGMSISSILVIFTVSPVIIAQCFSCQSYLNYEIFCKIHGFICFSSGIFNMYIVALLSFLRYFSIVHKTNCFNQFLENHRDLSVLLCAGISICWSLPSFFNIGSKYIQEDTGFYCSLKWNDPSINSRIFIISLICFNYIIPFFLVIYSNLRVWCIIRYLLKINHNINYSSSCLIDDNVILSIDSSKHHIDVQLKETANRLQRLKIDQRYAFITAIIAGQYIIIWTPYALIVILKFIQQTVLIERYPFLPTLFALFAKLSLILNPMILIYTNKMTHK